MATRPMATASERGGADASHSPRTRRPRAGDADEYSASIARITALGTSLAAWVLMVLALGLVAVLLIG